MAKTNGKRNRAAGHAYELEVVTAFKNAGFAHVVTSRNESRLRDAQKIDVVNRNEFKVGRLPYNVQCKSVSGKLAYPKVLSELPKEKDIINVVLHKQTVKAATNFITKDRFAIMYQADFFALIKELNQLKSKKKDENISD